MKIEMTKTKLVKNPETKSTYITESVETTEITKEQYYNITSEKTMKAFRRWGGSETAQRCYTDYGYLVYKLTSGSPNYINGKRASKTIREFKFI